MQLSRTLGIFQYALSTLGQFFKNKPGQMKKIPRVRERWVKKFPSVTVTGDTSTCLSLNGALRSRGDKELQISKAKIPENTRFEKNVKNRLFSAI